MFHLTREVRFAVNLQDDGHLADSPSNSFGGFPSLIGAGQQFALQVTLSGDLHPRTNYLLNIKEIDQAVRKTIVPLVSQRWRGGRFGAGGAVLNEIFEQLRRTWPEARLQSLRLCLTPTLSLEIRDSEHPMQRLTQRFEFCASHRLHNPALSDAENRAAFGKCNNPNGHGHNYEIEVTLKGRLDENGSVMPLRRLEQIVSESVIDRLDHKNLNHEVPEFRELNPSVENNAMVIYHMLKPRLASDNASLASVKVWETPKTWCEYAE